MSTKIVKYLAVVELGVPEGKVRELERWEVTPEDFLSSIISDHVQDRGVLCKTAIVEGELYKDVKEYAHQVSNHKAVAELEAEILEAKACIGGSCED
jgi:phage I-like protein